MRTTIAYFWVGLACLLAGCSTVVPNDGPLLSSVESSEERKDDFVYGLVSLTAKSVTSLANHKYYPLSEKFGLGRSGGQGLIGIGDVLRITIFEAGPDGIFSTVEKKNITIDATVQQNGRIAIPFAGSVKVVGKSAGQARSIIAGQLKNRAVEPDVVVEIAKNNSRTVVINGAVNAAKQVPLSLGSERILDVIGHAGGPSKPSYETYVSISRGSTTRSALLQTLIENPRENIYVRAGDAIYLSHNPRQFLSLGAVKESGRHGFGSRRLNLLEAIAVAGGFDDGRANPQAMYVFRYEYNHVVKHLWENTELSDGTLKKMAENPDALDAQGRLPIIYRIDLSDADNFFIAKRFPVRAGDSIYVARKGSVDFSKVVDLFSKAVSVARIGSGFD